MWTLFSNNLQESAGDLNPQSYVFGKNALNINMSHATVSRCQSVFWDVLNVLAEEAVSGRHHPAGRDQSAGAEIWLADVDGGHPGVWARQSRAAPQDPSPGHRHSLLVFFSTNWLLLALSGGSRVFRDSIEWDDPSGRNWKEQSKHSEVVHPNIDINRSWNWTTTK